MARIMGKIGITPLTELEKMEIEARRRLKWFIDGYFFHNLGASFATMSTEDVCEMYNVNMSYFRPWLSWTS
jgi:hypothetical protein